MLQALATTISRKEASNAVIAASGTHALHSIRMHRNRLMISVEGFPHFPFANANAQMFFSSFSNGFNSPSMVGIHSDRPMNVPGALNRSVWRIGVHDVET